MDVLSTIKHTLFQNKTVFYGLHGPLRVFWESFWGVHWTNHLFPTEKQKTHDSFQNYHFICRYFIVVTLVVTSRWLMWFQWVRGEDLDDEDSPCSPTGCQCWQRARRVTTLRPKHNKNVIQPARTWTMKPVTETQKGECVYVCCNNLKIAGQSFRFLLWITVVYLDSSTLRNRFCKTHKTTERLMPVH